MKTPLKLFKKHGGRDIPKETQQLLNKPLPLLLGQEYKKYFEMIRRLLLEKKIDLSNIHSIMNMRLYSSLPSKDQGVVDLSAVNILHLLRDVHLLLDQNFQETHQMRLLIEEIWQIKERVEQRYGNVFIV